MRYEPHATTDSRELGTYRHYPFVIAGGVWLMIMLTSCSYSRATEEGHSTLLPATVVCFLASCQAEFNDRNQRAGRDDKSTSETDTDMKQETSVDVSPVP